MRPLGCDPLRPWDPWVMTPLQLCWLEGVFCGDSSGVPSSACGPQESWDLGRQGPTYCQPACMGLAERMALAPLFPPWPCSICFPNSIHRADFPQLPFCCLGNIWDSNPGPGAGHDGMNGRWALLAPRCHSGTPEHPRLSFGRPIWNSSDAIWLRSPRLACGFAGVTWGQWWKGGQSHIHLIGSTLGQSCSWHPFLSSPLSQAASGLPSLIEICLNLQPQKLKERAALWGLCAGEEH